MLSTNRFELKRKGLNNIEFDITLGFVIMFGIESNLFLSLQHIYSTKTKKSKK